MSDSPKKPSKHAPTQAKFKKPVPNSLKLRAPHSVNGRQNVASILQRLPFLRQLDQSHNALLSLTPVWQNWCNASASQMPSELTLKLNENAALASFNDGVLSIACEHASIASLLKHQQASLLDAYDKAGFSQVKKIKIQMALNAHLNSPEQEQAHAKEESVAQNAKPRSKPTAASIKSIEATQSLTDNEQLAASLKRLAQTLKKEL